MKSVKEIKAKAELKEVLTKLGIRYKERGTEIQAQCMSGTHTDKDPSWSIHNEPGTDRHGLFHCFGCGWSGDVFSLVRKVKGCSFLKALEFVGKCKRTKIEIGNEDTTEEEYMRTFNTREPYSIEPPKGLRPIENGTQCMRYLAERGVGREEIDLYGLLDWRWRSRVFVPIARKKSLVTWVARSYNETNPKILYPTGEKIGTRWGLFGFDQVDKTHKISSLSEGWISAIRVRQAGFRNSIAICGAMLTEEQAEDLAWTEKLILWKEGDAAGKVFMKDVMLWLAERKVEVVQMPKGKDPADFIPSQLKQMYNRR